MTDEEILKKLEPLLLQVIAILRKAPKETEFNLEHDLTFLKNKEEIVQLAYSIEPKKQKARNMLLRNPKKSKKQVALETDISLSTVYLIWNNMKAEGKIK